MADMTETAKAIIRQAMEEADRRDPGHLEQGVALARLLERELGHPVKHRTVQAWARKKGIQAVPAQILLAAAKVTEISIDEFLEREPIRAKLDRFEQELAEVKRQMSTETKAKQR